MLLTAIGASLPAAVAIALSPFPIVGVVLILATARGRRNGLLFAVGWVVGLTAVTALVVVLFGGADDPDSASSAIADWGRVVGGAALIVLGVRTWWRRPRDASEDAVPGWMASLDGASAGRALVLGLLLSGANPKNAVLAAAAATSIVEAGVHGADLLVAVAVFVLVGSCTVLGAVAASMIGGPGVASVLDTVRRFMVANSAVIMVLVLLILGATILGDGLTGLGR